MTRTGASQTGGGRTALQIAGGSSFCGRVRCSGTVALERIRLSLPSVRR